ncbi:unnamed protein product [Angiostrongylus costaricensis]|uniref:TORC_N domain-containing protein n=1 Tax=Angiostrongylus costaricensis TaxID=334426 RepID=A0A158PH64_ANGCS|nr:unnamed protein product [Angiostrongylus costaricensis]
MSSTSPRKFAEKIAIMNRKQSEDMSTFDSIMREVRQITSSSETQTTSQPSTSLCPPQWNPIGGSLPNVHQMPSYHTDWGASWIPTTQNAHRSRSSDQHPILYHPYGRGQRSPDRVPPLGPHYVPYPNPQYQLLAPEQWNHASFWDLDLVSFSWELFAPYGPVTSLRVEKHSSMGGECCNVVDISSYHFQKGTELSEGLEMVIFLEGAELHWKKSCYGNVDELLYSHLFAALSLSLSLTPMAGPSGLNQMMPFGLLGSIPNNMVSSQQGMVLPVQTMVGAPLQSSHPSDVQGISMQSPLHSPLGYHMQNYGFPNGSPMQSPIGSPISSSMMLEERTTPVMELSPPSASDPCSELRGHFYEEFLPT